MTNGPYQATGSRIGCPASTTTSTLGVVVDWCSSARSRRGSPGPKTTRSPSPTGRPSDAAHPGADRQTAARRGVLLVVRAVGGAGPGPEGAVGKRVGALGLGRAVLHGPHLVHVDAAVKGLAGHPGERPPAGEALAVEARRRGGHPRHR